LSELFEPTKYHDDGGNTLRGSRTLVSAHLTEIEVKVLEVVKWGEMLSHEFKGIIRTTLP
jgi:hypothetical protein